ncbi:MAG: YhcH/YjgK/YiaL family protein [Prevotellaceae bacterium]|nr:YhcH/YjgK/YiaL family protein [Candidatus Colivivens equi]
MVYDNINNIELYRGLSEDIYAGLKFLSSVDSSIENGVHTISENVKAIVSEYETKTVNPNGFEAHCEYLDIQYLISGNEIIKCKPIEGLCVTKEYDAENDYLLFSDKVNNTLDCLLGDGYFTLLYPDDAHEPQLCAGNPMIVKKIVIKIHI